MTIAAQFNAEYRFGSEQDGTVLWHTSNNGSSSTSPFLAVHVQAGTLKDGDGELSFLLDNAARTTIDAGATIDLAGFDTTIAGSDGRRRGHRQRRPATLTLDAANFSGTISGALSLVFNGDASLSGLEDYTGGATLDGPITVTNAGTYDLVANANITGAAGSSFVNNGLFEKTGGGGVSDVTSNFVNNGTLNVLSGSLQFSGGFTNDGVIHGRVTQSERRHHRQRPVPSDFNGDGLSDILWQNGERPGLDLGDEREHPDRRRDRSAPIPGRLDRDRNRRFQRRRPCRHPVAEHEYGQVSIWEMNGNTLIGGGAVSPNPGPAWKAIGTGDFNGDGLSDILLQNTSTGQVSIWEMNGNALIGGGPVSPNPGPAWKAIGTGDFNGDGHSDILFQNTSSGQVSIWEMNGNNLIGGGPVSPNPGPSLESDRNRRFQ